MTGLMDGRRAEGQTDEWSIPRFPGRFGGHASKIVPTVTNCSQHLHGRKQIVSVADDRSRIEDAQFRSDPRVVVDGVHSSRLSPRWRNVPTVAEELRQLPLPDLPPPRCPLSVTVPKRMWCFRQVASAAGSWWWRGSRRRATVTVAATRRGGGGSRRRWHGLGRRMGKALGSSPWRRHDLRFHRRCCC